MKVIRPSEVPEEDAASPLFLGAVMRQSLVTSAMSGDYNLGMINFAVGARNKFHRHTHDQVLIITYGTGIVATDQAEVEVHNGELVLVPAGEKHWHGATPTSAMSHISLTAAGSQTEILE
jgi:quercetin dioxygenase-like cupin family protein